MSVAEARIRGEGPAAEVALDREFLLTFTQLLQVSRYHELDNDAVIPLLRSTCDLSNEICVGGRRLRVLVNRDAIFVNRRRVRFATGAIRTTMALIRLLERRGLIGFEVEDALTPSALSGFLRAFHGVPGNVEEPVDLLRRALESEGITGIVLLVPGKQDQEDLAAVRLDEGEAAAQYYARTLVLLRETIRCWEHEDTRRYLGARTKRVIQQIISLAERSPRPFLWLAHVKDDSEYLYAHSTNVALISVLIGLRIGLTRNEIAELGIAALFHDLGRIALPGRVLAKRGEFDAGERMTMARHPVHGVNLLLGTGSLSEPILRRLIVIFEHNIDCNGYPRKHWPGGIGLASRIVAVADAYDAMTTRKSYRPAMNPDEAMRRLTTDSGTRYDGDIVKVLGNVLGIFPLGTLVTLDTGEGALVFHVDPWAPRRPIVKLVWNEDGVRYEDGEIVDLGEKNADGEYLRTITGTEEPAARGIEVPGYLSEAAS